MLKALKRIVVLVVVLLVVLVLGGFTLLRERTEKVLRRDEPDTRQSAAQLSRDDARRVRLGMTEQQLRALVGKADRITSAEVEGVTVDCWYYGVVGITGAYQICFANGRLRSKTAFNG